MDKKLLEEINKILFINSYKIGKTLNEQKLTDSEDIITEDYETKTKNLSIDIGNRRNKMLAKQTGSMDLDLGYTINKEIDEELTAPLNVIQKMNAELGSDYAYNSLSGEQKKLLGEAYFNALEAILDNPKAYIAKDTSKTDKQFYRKLKKFFKKSQRWVFSIDEVIVPKELKDIAISLYAEAEPEQLESLKTEMDQTLDDKFTNECQVGVVLSKKQDVFAGTDENGGLLFTPVEKSPLTFLFSYQSQNIEAAKIKESSVKTAITNVNIQIPKMQVSFDPGKSDPKPFLSSLMKDFNNVVYNTKVDVNVPGGDVESKTIQEMVNCSKTLDCDYSYKIEFTYILVTSSASNTWDGKDKLLYSLTNDGEHTADCSDIKEIYSAGGNNMKNAQLAGKRGSNLLTAVNAELLKNTDFVVSDKMSKFIDVEVTDTGGKLDSDPTKTLPNPGQYAEFSINVTVTAEKDIRKPAESELTGEVANRAIVLQYVGGGSTFRLNMNLDFDDAMYAQYIDRGIFGQNGRMRLGRMRRRSKKNLRRGVRKGSHVKPIKR
jgi:hypothetical protein